MSNELAVYERELPLLAPKFSQLLAGSGLAPERLIRTVLVCLERTPALLDCSQQSILACAMTAGALGLEADGATGQFFMLPFNTNKGRIAQSCIGYKGYNTLAGRSGFTITGAVVREGEHFEFVLGSNGSVEHRPLLGGGRNRRIIGAWACAMRPGFAPMIEVLDIDEIMYVKGRSPGARKADGPWNDPDIGFPAMAAKTAKRRLARSMPLNLMVTAAAMEEAFEERGVQAFIHPEKGLVVDGEAQPVGEPQPGTTTPVSVLSPPRWIIHKAKTDVICTSIEDYRAKMETIASKLTTDDNLKRFLELNEGELDRYYDAHPREIDAIGKVFEARKRAL